PVDQVHTRRKGRGNTVQVAIVRVDAEVSERGIGLCAIDLHISDDLASAARVAPFGAQTTRGHELRGALRGCAARSDPLVCDPIEPPTALNLGLAEPLVELRLVAARFGCRSPSVVRVE